MSLHNNNNNNNHRNQEQCGSCWAFSASEVLSDRLCIATDGKTDLVLSPQYMVSCDTRNYGCDGGYLNLAWNFLVTTGIPSDACVPYTSGDGKSNGKCVVNDDHDWNDSIMIYNT